MIMSVLGKWRFAVAMICRRYGFLFKPCLSTRNDDKGNSLLQSCQENVISNELFPFRIKN